MDTQQAPEPVSTYDCGCNIMPCGCEQGVYCPNGGYDIVYCPTHASAPALLEALEHLEKEARRLRVHSSCAECAEHDVYGALFQARAAIKQAKGE